MHHALHDLVELDFLVIHRMITSQEWPHSKELPNLLQHPCFTGCAVVFFYVGEQVTPTYYFLVNSLKEE